MVINKSIGERTFDTFNVAFMALLMVVTVYPVLYVIFASVSDPVMLQGHTGLLFGPLGEMNIEGYKIAFRDPRILVGYKNTFIYVLFGTSLNIFMTSLGAYVLSRNQFVLRKFMTLMIIITMFFQGGMIPMFVLLRTFGLLNTRASIILPVAINAYNLIIMRTFFYNIPKSLEEAATIDGATDFQIFWRVILPLSKPVIAVMVLYYGVFHWNSWFSANIYLSRAKELHPLQLVLRNMIVANSVDSKAASGQQMIEESLYKDLLQYCVIVMATLPILSIYPFLQKYFVKGVMMGAVKQ